MGSDRFEILISNAIPLSQLYVTIVIVLSRNYGNSVKKPILGPFQGFSVCTLLRPMSYAPIFGQIKGLIEIHKRVKFHQYSMCRCEVIYLQRRSERKKLDFWLLLGGFSRITPPNEVGFVQNFHQ